METQVRTPQAIFGQSQRLDVPLFQRPYVWNEGNQWEPLWNDINHAVDRLEEGGGDGQPHFLGAVVLQQTTNPTGSLQTRIVIDGQQRLTTLQVLLDAIQAQFEALGAANPARRLETLIVNPEAFCEQEHDRFKVWPTIRDQDAFAEVMNAPAPVDYDNLVHREHRLVEAHRFFSTKTQEWLTADDADSDLITKRAEMLEKVARDLIQVVVIDLEADENAQEIFETLNARGAQLTAADLIKNFVFQRLSEDNEDTDKAYWSHWQKFETGFWEQELSVGRRRYSRSSIFLNHWLIARTGEEIVARDVFSRFKRYGDHESNTSMAGLVAEISRSAEVYRKLVEGESKHNPIDRLELFAYRTSTLQSEVFKPVVVWLLDPDLEPIPDTEITRCLDVVESWLVRRMLVRATTKSYGQTAAELVSLLRRNDRASAGQNTEQFFAEQTADSRYWPSDRAVTQALAEMPAYKRLQRRRLRMVLEAVEDHRRGWSEGKPGMGGERVARGSYHIEHVMPQSWQKAWPLGDYPDLERDEIVHNLGNLTLLTNSLNSSVSHSAWSKKREALKMFDVLKINSDLLSVGDTWDEDHIFGRAQRLAQTICQIWPVPEGHEPTTIVSTEQSKRVSLADLIASDLLSPGTVLHARGERFAGRTAVLLPDGTLDVDGRTFNSPSGAATHIAGASRNGWWFFVLEAGSKYSINDLYEQHFDDAVESDGSDDIDDDDTSGGDVAGAEVDDLQGQGG